MEGMMFHKCLVDQPEVPLFLRVPNESTKNYKQIMQEFSPNGFLNLNSIIQKLKSKKYGPGRNMIKIDVLNTDIRKLFSVCEKYYSYDPNSIRISRTLEVFFESEIKLSDRIQR